MNDTIFCHNCGTKNRATSAFCKNCGASMQIPTSDSSANTASETPIATPKTEVVSIIEPNITADPKPNAQPLNVEPAGAVVPVLLNEQPNFGSVPPIADEDIEAYMGESSEKLFKKYKKHCTGKSTWNWPVFFLSLLGVPFVWFFYRKMKKTATVVLAIWLALTCVSATFTYLAYASIETPILSFTESSLDIVEDEFRVASGVNKANKNNKTIDKEFNKMIDNLIGDGTFIVLFVANALIVISQIVFVFILSAKANKFYFNMLNADIRKLKSDGADACLIRKHGGVNITTAVTTGFLLGFLTNLIIAAPVIIFSVQILPELWNTIEHTLSNMGITIIW